MKCVLPRRFWTKISEALGNGAAWPHYPVAGGRPGVLDRQSSPEHSDSNGFGQLSAGHALTSRAVTGISLSRDLSRLISPPYQST